MTDILGERIRLQVLRLLDDVGAPINIGVLHDALLDLGLPCSRDRLTSHLHWLSEQQLLTVEDLARLLVCDISPRGQDVARGLARVPGVARRSAGD
jgi:DNA-binding transcriptional ArsR family regulator